MDHSLVIYFAIDCKSLAEQGRSYPWPAVGRCPRCGGSRLRGHGYVGRYFEEIAQRVTVKRFRCLDCRAVHTGRPQSHWRRLIAGVQGIVESLTRKCSENRWSAGFSRQRQQYWWRGLQRQLAADGLPGVPTVASLAALLQRSLIAATHSLIFREIRRFDDALHRTFALTPPVGWR